jgi:hypothetical protein
MSMIYSDPRTGRRFEVASDGFLRWLDETGIPLPPPRRPQNLETLTQRHPVDSTPHLPYVHPAPRSRTIRNVVLTVVALLLIVGAIGTLSQSGGGRTATASATSTRLSAN